MIHLAIDLLSGFGPQNALGFRLARSMEVVDIDGLELTLMVVERNIMS